MSCIGAESSSSFMVLEPESSKNGRKQQSAPVEDRMSPPSSLGDCEVCTQERRESVQEAKNGTLGGEEGDVGSLRHSPAMRQRHAD